MKYIVYLLISAVAITLFACGEAQQEEQENQAATEKDEASQEAISKEQIFEDADVLRWAVDRVYRKRVFEEREAFVIKDDVAKKSYRVEMVDMPEDEMYPVGTETAYLGVHMKRPNKEDTLIVDFKMGWNPELHDPKYNRKGTFEVLDTRVRKVNGETRYRWQPDGDYWKTELVTEPAL